MTQGCVQPTGVSIAAATTVQQLAALRSEAETLLAIMLAVTQDVDAIAADQVNFNTTYLSSEQFSTWVPPPRPQIPVITFNAPTPPPDPELEAVTPIVIDANLPPLSSELIAKLTAALLGVLNTLSDGLPAGYANALWERASSRLSGHITSIRRDVADDYVRRGWTLPAVTTTARSIAFRQLGYSLEALIIRDAKIKVYETAAEVFKAALGAIAGYFKVYADIYKDYIDALADLARTQINENELIVARLQALVELFEARSSAERAEIEAESASHSIEAALYAASTAEGGSIAQRDTAAASLESERRTGAAQDALENADGANAEKQQNIQAAFQNFQVTVDNLGRILAAAAQAKGVSASISSGTSITNGRGCSTSYSYTENIPS